MQLNTLIQTVTVLVLLMIVGYTGAKKGVFTPQATKAMSALVFNVFLASSAFSSICKDVPEMSGARLLHIMLVLAITMIYDAIADSKYTKKDYDEFLSMWEAGELAEVEFQPDRILFLTKEEAAKDPSEQKACVTGLPYGGDTMEMSAKLKADGIKVNTLIQDDNSYIWMILYYAPISVYLPGLLRKSMISCRLSLASS